MLQDPRARFGKRRLIAEPYPPWLLSIGITVVLGLAYFLAARLSLALLAKPAGVAVFWPAAGVAAGFLISMGPSARWPVIVATMAGTIAANTLGDRNLPSAVVFALCNAGEALLISALLEKFFGSPFSLDQIQRVLGLLAAAIIGTAVSGIGGMLGYVLFHTSTASALTIWTLWFASDAIGVIAVAPLIIGIFSVIRDPPQHKEVLEGLLVLALTAVLSAFVVHLPSTVWALELAIACLLPLMLWVAARCPPAFAAATTFIFALTVVWTTTFGVGIFGSSELAIADRILIAQVVILAQSLCALVLAALFAERRQQEAKLTESEARLQDALRAGEVAAFDWLAPSAHARLSDNAAQILGYDPRGTFTTAQFLERIHPSDRQGYEGCVRGLRPHKPAYAVTFRYLRPDGREVWLEETARAEFDRLGLIRRISGLTRDITERKRVELELATARSAAELADRAKSSFLAAASHDLRQPLQTLQLLQTALKPHVADGKASTLVDGIGRSANTMNSILNSLLDINRLEAGALCPSISEFPIIDVFESVTHSFVEPIEEKKLALRVVRSGIVVRSDKRMLEEILRNLLSNAVRYTDQGRILIGCRRAGEKARIEVWDSGVGIVGEELPRIFEEYYQAQDNAKLEGFGLGLAIVQRLAKVLNHQVDVRSTPGKGSGFSIEVPLVQQKANVADRPTSPSGEVDDPFVGTILVVEDESSVRMALDALLSSSGLGVVCVATGKEALDLVTTERMRPDLIICDFNLPGTLNGVEVIETLRAALAQKVPAIVMTGDIRSRAITSIAGHDVGLAVKPILGDELLQLINDVHARSK